ncbi:MAG: SHOCT domain-containing protein [Lachnospiraceae bacterium]|nr:SHOCT domain-containing protein [Lachnospiraceae bacterium]
MSSAELRWYLRWAPFKLVLAVVLFGYDAYKRDGITLETCLEVVLAYGIISTFAFAIRLSGNIITGTIIFAIILVVGVFIDKDNSTIGSIVTFAICLLGPLLDIFFLILLIRASRKEKKLYNSEMEANRQYVNHIQAEEARAQSASNAEELMKFKQLLDAGAITQEEYDSKKQQLLGL